MVPAIYADYGHPDELSAAQRRRILDLAERKRPHGRAVWFILVHANHADAGREDDFSTTVYYSPDQSNGDLRRGRCLFVSGFRMLSPHLEPELSEYVQVSPTGEPFGNTLDVPKLPDLPFEPPTQGLGGKPADIAPEELVRLVHFIRHARVAGTDDARPEPSRTEPILEIRVGKEEFEITTGWVSGPLAGGGHVLRIDKIKDGYRLVDEGFWRA